MDVKNMGIDEISVLVRSCLDELGVPLESCINCKMRAPFMSNRALCGGCDADLLEARQARNAPAEKAATAKAQQAFDAVEAEVRTYFNTRIGDMEEAQLKFKDALVHLQDELLPLGIDLKGDYLEYEPDTFPDSLQEVLDDYLPQA